VSSAPSAPGAPAQSSSIGELLSDITKDVSTLMRQEVELAKAELKESAGQAGKGAGMLGGSAIFAHFALLFLSLAAWWGLGNAIGRAWSALVIMVVMAAIAGVLALVGRKELQSVTGMPKTTSTLKKIPDAAKGNEGTMR
jgi:uncharacterized membrane protein YqjE